MKYLRLHLGEFWHLLPYCILVCGILNWILGYLTGNLKGLFFYTNYLLCSLMVLALAARREIPMISRRLDKFMGDLSYPIYLVHYQVGLFIVASGLVPEKPSLALVLVSLPVILLLAWGMAVSLERPIDVIRRRVKA